MALVVNQVLVTLVHAHHHSLTHLFNSLLLNILCSKDSQESRDIAVNKTETVLFFLQVNIWYKTRGTMQ